MVLLTKVDKQSPDKPSKMVWKSIYSKFRCPSLIKSKENTPLCRGPTSRARCVGRIDSAQDASSHVSTVTEPVLYEFDVFQVIFDNADQMT